LIQLTIKDNKTVSMTHKVIAKYPSIAKLVTNYAARAMEMTLFTAVASGSI
jgi:hypothetical protein